MLPRNFTEEQNMFRDAYRKFLEQEITPHMEKRQKPIRTTLVRLACF